MSTETATSPKATSRPTWVVGFDGSDHARAALDWAAASAAAHEADLRVVAAWQFSYFGEVPLPGGAIPATSIETQDEIATDIEAIAKGIADSTGVAVSTLTIAGAASDVLLSNLEDAELAIVGTRGRGGFARLLLGSVSSQVAAHSTRPTIIVPPDSQGAELRRAVIGVDGSANSAAALRWIHSFAPLDCELVAVHAWEPAGSGLPGLGPDTYQLLHEASEGQFNTAVTTVEEELGDPNRFKRVFETGHPGRVLLDAANGADLIVVGARGQRGVVGTVLGSISNWVIHHLPCPGAVIPDTEASSPEPS